MDIFGKFRFSKADDSRYRLLVEAIEDYAIYMLDRTGIVTSWNPGAQRFKGYTADEIVGEHFSLFYTEEDQKKGVPALTLEFAARDGRFENEGWRVRKDGTRFSGGPLDHWYADAGGPLGVWRNWANNLTGHPIEGGHFFPEHNPRETAVELCAFFGA